ncbi:MAG: hypothetical protein JXL84_25835 [Deltaproteobacteria bacterium]|nr:hypothetical protein [Deltaproteobacteria bacterium]
MAVLSRIRGLGGGRKKTLLAVLLCLFAVSLTYRILNPYKQERVTRLTYTGRDGEPSRARAAGPKAGEAVVSREVMMDLFLNPPPHSGKVRNNIFFRSKEIVTQAKAAPSAEAKVIAPVGKQAPVIDKRLQVQEELSHFKSFGFMQQGKQKILFLERGKDILVIREGDRIAGKYLVKGITEKVLTIRAENIDEDIRIDLSRF